MNRDSKKIALAQRLFKEEDESKLFLIEAVLDGRWSIHTQHEDSDFWKNLPEGVKMGINKAIQSIKVDGGTPHDEVMSRLKSKYGLQ